MTFEAPGLRSALERVAVVHWPVEADISRQDRSAALGACRPACSVLSLDTLSRYAAEVFRPG